MKKTINEDFWKWIKKPEIIDKIKYVIDILNEQKEFTNSLVFEVPYNKFRMDKSDLQWIIKRLQKEDYITIIHSTEAEQFERAINPSIKIDKDHLFLSYTDTLIKLNPTKFQQLHNALNETFINTIPKDWCWLNKAEGKYQFGKIVYEQSGRTRKEIFQALMDILEKSPHAISTKSLGEIISVDTGRMRIEISAINKRLKNKAGYYFKGSGKGYYTLEKIDN